MVASSVYYMHEDALGSVRLVATATVTIKFSSNYLPYGSNYAMVGKEAFMYTGKMYDSATGLYYLMARYYDSTIGRFVTEDSYGGDENDPMTMNRYIYASDNPERYSDPDGHMFVVETDSGQEVGGDYLYTPAVVKTVTVADTERKRNEYYVTDTPVASTSQTEPGGSMAAYQNMVFGRTNPYGGGLVNPYLSYREEAFGGQNPYGTPTIGTTQAGPFSSCQGATAAGIFTVFASAMGLSIAGNVATFGLSATAVTVVTGGLAALPFIGLGAMMVLWYKDPTCRS